MNINPASSSSLSSNNAVIPVLNPSPAPVPALFPEKLRFFLPVSGNKGAEINEAEIRSALVDTAVRQQFLAWAKEHSLLVSRSPLILYMMKISREYDTKVCFIAQERFCENFEKGNYNFDTLTSIQELKQNIGLIYEYFSLGMIQPEQIVTLLSKPLKDEQEQKLSSGAKELSFLHIQESFKVVILFLRKLSFEHRIFLLSSTDAQGNTPLHNDTFFTEYLPDLEKMPFDEFDQVVSIHNARGIPVVFGAIAFKVALSRIGKEQLTARFLKEATIQDIIKIFSHSKIIANEEAVSIIISHVIDQLQCSHQELVSVLSAQCMEGPTPLHFKKNFQQLAPHLKKLSFPLLVKILSIRDAIGTPVAHSSGVFEVLLPHINELTAQKKCTPERFQQILLIKDSKNRTPLFNKDNFSAFLRHAADLKSADFLAIVSTRDADGVPLWHNRDIMQIAMPRIVKYITDNQLSQEELAKILFMRNANGATFFCNKPNLEDLLAVFSTPIVDQPCFCLSPIFRCFLDQAENTLHLTPEQMYTIITRLSSKGWPAIHYVNNLECFLQYLQKIPFDQHSKFFSIPGRDGILPLNNTINFTATLPSLVAAYTPEQLLKILSIRNAQGYTTLHFPEHLPLLLPFLQKMPFEECAKFFSITYMNGTPLLHDIQLFNSVIKFLETNPLPFDWVLQVLSLKDRQGRSALHDEEIFSWAVSHYLDKLSKEEIKKIFAIVCSNGYTLLHYKKLCDMATDLCVTHKIDLSEFVHSKNGLSAADLYSHSLVPAWLTRPKTAGFCRQEITKEEYDQKIEALQVRFSTLWKTVEVSFEKRELSDTLFYVNGEQFLPVTIKDALETMFTRMKKQEARLGTPRADDLVELHRFYSTQLIDFEIILSELEKRNIPAETAGHLTDLAALPLSETCASGDQAALEQKRMLLMGEPSDLDSLVNRSATLALRWQIDQIVRTEFGGDVHATNQLYFAASITDQPDTLPPEGLGIEEAQQKILNSFDPRAFYHEFSHRITDDMASEWLRAHMPDDFGPEYLQLQKSIREDEAELLQELKPYVVRCVPQDLVEKFLSQLQATKAPSCVTSGLQTLDTHTLLGRVFNGAPLFRSCLQHIDPSVSYVSYEDLKAAIHKETQVQKRALPQDRDFPHKIRQVLQAQEALLEQIQAVFRFQELMEAYAVPLAKRLPLLRAIQVYQSSIEILGEDILPGQGINNYSQATHRLPSNAIADARHLAWTNEQRGKPGKMREQILLQLGVIQKKL